MVSFPREMWRIGINFNSRCKHRLDPSLTAYTRYLLVNLATVDLYPLGLCQCAGGQRVIHTIKAIILP